VPLLEQRGHEVSAPDLPGSGKDLTPVGEVTLDAYADRVCAILAQGDEPAILVGHSMGGMVVTQAAARCPERIARLVYVAAFLPHDGQSLLDLTQLPEGADDQVQANLTIDGNPAVGVLTPKAIANALFNCCTKSQLDWALERVRPQPLAPFLAPVRIGARPFPADRRVYVFCSRDHAIPPVLQRRMSDENPCGETRELDTDHSPFLSRPSQLAKLLDALTAKQQLQA